MSNKSRYFLTAAAVGCTALYAVQASAAGTVTGSTSIDQLQQQINDLQQQVQAMKKAQAAQPTTTSSSASSSGPTKKLNIGGGAVAEYQKTHNDKHGSAGSLVLDYFDLNATGQYGKLTYAADYRWSTTNFKSGQYLHYAWADYAFGQGDSSHIRGGMFKVPFGNLPYGYQSFWANLGYYAGLTDNDAAGVGYRYEANGWRFDLDAFKNADLGQQSTYGANPTSSINSGQYKGLGYRLINGGNARLGYTFNLNGDNTLNVSAAARGGQLEVDRAGSSVGGGNRWAATVAADANLGNWVLQGQIADYKYNVPGDAKVPTDTITMQDYGYDYNMPAKGQLYTATIGRNFPVDMGPISNFEIYDDYGYLHSGVGSHDNAGNRIGDVQENVAGVAMTAGPVYVWAEMISAKNGAMAFDGPNNGKWYHRFNLTAAFYFDGDVIKN